MASVLPRDPSTLVDTLREAILDGRLAPGERLVHEELAARYGTSTTPLRTALRRLEGEGLISNAQKRDTHVRHFGPKDIVDLYDVRLALETLAVWRASVRVVDVREKTLADAQEATVAMRTENVPALVQLDCGFHSSIVAASENEHLNSVLEGQWPQVKRVMHSYLSVTAYVEQAWREHVDIAHHIAHGDGDRAARAIRRHLTKSRDRVLADLRERR